MCGNSHSWESVISSRYNGKGCPYCSGRYAIIGVNDLQTVNPILANEWNYEKNNGLTPADVLPSSNKKVWWKCSKEHEWEATVANRNKGNDCPYCSGRCAIIGVNDLQTVNPILANEWNFEKNGELRPNDVMPNSSRKVWWKCDQGHEWQAIISNRSKGNGCIYCAGQKVLVGYNDLQTVNPRLAEEWNYEKNHGLLPVDVTANSGKKVWWKCSKGHEWKATIHHRNNGEGCPTCYLERRTSFPEYVLEYYLKMYGVEVIHSYKELGYELDLYIRSEKTAIEYDGYWHKNKRQKDLEKNAKCEKDGIKLYRIREGLFSLNDSSIDYVVQKDQKDLSTILKMVLREIIGEEVNVDLDRDSTAIESLREYIEKESSIVAINPELAKEWNYEKNGQLKPEYFFAKSNKKVWWKCSKGHEWRAKINNRSRGDGCPYCSGRLVVKGENDLQTVNPLLGQEWNYEKNNGLTPMDVMPNSHKKVWWKCNKEHEWQATVATRNRGRGCPYCAGRYVIKGENDLQTVNPTLAKEWNYEKNEGLTPEDVMPSSHKKVWWQCGQGHEWQARIADRNRGRGCRKCSKRKVNPLTPKMNPLWVGSEPPN